MKRFFIIVMMAVCLSSCSSSYDSLNAPIKGKWITASSCSHKPNTWIMYRHTPVISSLPDEMIARIAVDSKYWLWINGEMVVFEGGLKRGPMPEGTYYDTIDIAPYLKKGKNTIAILMWYWGKDGFSHNSSGRAGLLFDAQSQNEIICSDTTWTSSVYDAYSDTDAPHPNYRLPESNIRYDARLGINDWYKKESDISLPQAVELDSIPYGTLVARPIPMWKDYGLKEYVDTMRCGDTLKCRLPYNCHVTPYIQLSSVDGGDTVRIMTDNYNGGSEKNVRGEYITTSGVQEYENLGWMNGHYVWYIIPDDVKVMSVKYRETGYDTEFVGAFTCDDPFLNEVWKRSARTLYVTMRDTYMDCPDRERAQWWGDAVNELGEAFYALSPSSQLLAKKGIYELMNYQRENGTIYSPVPSGSWNTELPLQMLASVGWYGFYTQYYYSGDSSFVADIYTRLHRYLHDVWQVDEKGMTILRKGEWNWGDWGEDIDMGVLTSCWYYLALKAEKEFARMVGRNEDIPQIDTLMKGIEKGFDEAFWNGRVYRSKEHIGADDDRAQAMAVVSGLANKEYYPHIIEALKKEYHASPYMEKYVLEALYMLGEDTFALQRIHDRYAKMLAYEDYTTLFEGWGIGAEGFGGGTINHAWSGGPLTMMSQKVCGITPTSPAFKTFCVKPQMGYLTHASATMMVSGGGVINVDVKVEGEKTIVEVDVPKGHSAEVILPCGKSVSLGEGHHVVE